MYRPRTEYILPFPHSPWVKTSWHCLRRYEICHLWLPSTWFRQKAAFESCEWERGKGMFILWARYIRKALIHYHQRPNFLGNRMRSRDMSLESDGPGAICAESEPQLGKCPVFRVKATHWTCLRLQGCKKMVHLKVITICYIMYRVGWNL